MLMNSSIFNSNKLPVAAITAFVIFILTVASGFSYLYSTDNMPAPMFSNSYSIDEKFRFLRLNKSSNADYIVLGSSTGLSNIHSETMLNHPKIGQSYLNYSAWGFNATALLEHWRI